MARPLRPLRVLDARTSQIPFAEQAEGRRAHLQTLRRQHASLMLRKRKAPKTPVLRFDVGDDIWYQEGFPTWAQAEARQMEIEGYMERDECFRTCGGYLIPARLIKRIWINDFS